MESHCKVSYQGFPCGQCVGGLSSTRTSWETNTMPSKIVHLKDRKLEHFSIGSCPHWWRVSSRDCACSQGSPWGREPEDACWHAWRDTKWRKVDLNSLGSLQSKLNFWRSRLRPMTVLDETTVPMSIVKSGNPKYHIRGAAEKPGWTDTCENMWPSLILLDDPFAGD